LREQPASPAAIAPIAPRRVTSIWPSRIRPSRGIRRRTALRIKRLACYLAAVLNNVMSGAHGEAYDLVFEALAHPARRRILTSLNFAGGAMTAGAIAGLFAHAWPTTTRHLQALERAGIVVHRRDGRTRVYTLSRARLSLAGGWLGWFNRDPVTGQELTQDDDEHPEPVPAQHRGR
jgi:DNA-binding transcriptional ArsR family regulator